MLVYAWIKAKPCMGIAWLALLIQLALLVCIVTMGRSIIFGIRRKIKRSADDERLKVAMSFISPLLWEHASSYDFSIGLCLSSKTPSPGKP